MNKRPRYKWLAFVPIIAYFILVVAVATGHADTPLSARAQSPAAVGYARSTPVTTPANVSDAMRALDRLASYGYRWTTAVGADKAIRNWQQINGLTVDGIVGTETLASLGLAKTDQASPKVTKGHQKSPSPAPAAPSVDSSAPAVNEPGDPESIIRDVWPDDVESWAVKIATREANLQPGVHNPCCWGLFQVNWPAHHKMLAAFGVTDPHQLLDPRTNATVALALFQAAGVHPWDCHGQCTDIPL
jgi:hypothetical protein